MNLADQLDRASSIAELTGEELVRRGQDMLKLGHQLLAFAHQAAIKADTVDPNQAAANQQDLEDLTKIGSKGARTVSDGIRIARELKQFTVAAFCEELGITRPSAMKWLVQMISADPPIVELVQEGSQRLYRYLEPPEDGRTSAPRSAPQIERLAGVGTQKNSSGEAAAFSGKARGRSGSPSRDKKLSQTHRIKGLNAR